MSNSHPANATVPNGSNGSSGEGTQDTVNMKDSTGWDGKLRVDRRPVITNPEALEDPEYTDEEAPPVEEIEADEGMDGSFWGC